MSLSQGLWSTNAVIIYSTVAVLLTVVSVVGLQYRSTQWVGPRVALAVPIVVGGGVALVLKATGHQVWFWLLIGTAVSVGAAGTLGTAVRTRQRTSAAISLALLGSGVVVAGLLSQVPFRWTVLLVAVVSVIGFVSGYVIPAVGRRDPEQTVSVS